MPAHDKRAGGTNESGGTYRTSEFHTRSTAQRGLFAARWHGPNVWRDFHLGDRGCFQELSKGLCPVACVLHHAVPPALHKHTHANITNILLGSFRTPLLFCRPWPTYRVHNIMQKLCYCPTQDWATVTTVPVVHAGLGLSVPQTDLHASRDVDS